MQKKVPEFKVSKLATSFSTSSPGSLVLSIVLMTPRVSFVFNNIGKTRDPGTLSYHLTGSC